MFIQQYNGYYYLTEKRCGQVAKIYLGTIRHSDLSHEKELYSKMIEHIEQSSAYLSFISLVNNKQTILKKVLTFNYSDLRSSDQHSLRGYRLNNYITDFVYHSNKSEGSKIAREDFMKIINNKKPSTTNRNEIKEVTNSFLARDFLLDGFVRNESSIKKLHKILTQGLLGEDGLPYQTGYKKYNNIVGNLHTTDYKQVTDAMKNLLLRYKTNKKVLFPLHLAFELHYKFERIHPFADGNGRIGRLLMNKILYDHKFIPLTIFSENRTAYFNAFQKSIDRGSKELYGFLIDQYAKTLGI